jgi:thiamine pyrophosphokinase
MQARRAVIFANGEQLDLAAIGEQIREDDVLVAADGGLRYLRKLGLQPHRVIGDLDSLTPEEIAELEMQRVQIDRYPREKDETDLEIALKTVIQEGYSSVLVLAALGGRLDMTLANIALLALPELAPVDVRLDDGIEEVFLIRPSAGDGDKGRLISGLPGERVSLLAWGGPAQGVRTDGLYYPLCGETLYPEYTRGISNHMLEDTAWVSLEQGLLICIHARQPALTGTK